MALAAGPRFALVGLWYLVTRRPRSRMPALVGLAGVLRTLTAATWMFVTSSDHADVHDFAMISCAFSEPAPRLTGSDMVLTIPWMFGSIALAPSRANGAQRWRKAAATAFFGAIPPLIYLYVQHKVHRRAGAYSRYAYCEWWLILSDIAFDAATALDFASLEIQIVDLGVGEKGEKGEKTESQRYGQRVLPRCASARRLCGRR